MTDRSEGIGVMIRGEREARGIGLEELAEATKVRRVFLEALESERWEALPARVFVAGYLKAIAQHLSVNPQGLLAAYDQACPPASEASAVSAHPAASPKKRRNLALVAAALAGAVVLAAAVSSYVYRSPKGKVAEPEPSSAPAAVAAEIMAVAKSPEAAPPGLETEPAPSPRPAVSSNGLVLETSGPCWVELYRGQERLVYRQMRAGERVAFEGGAFRLTVGDASVVKLFYDKATVAMPNKAGTVVKDMRLGEKASEPSGR